MYRTEDIIEAAKTIRPNLKDLLGAESERFENDLSELIEKTERGEDVEIELIDLLSGNEKTREWMADALKDKRQPDGEKGFSTLPGLSYSGLPGYGPPVPGVVKYACPTAGCEYFWIRHRVGQTIPTCKICKVSLIPEETQS